MIIWHKPNYEKTQTYTKYETSLYIYSVPQKCYLIHKWGKAISIFQLRGKTEAAGMQKKGRLALR